MNYILPLVIAVAGLLSATSGVSQHQAASAEHRPGKLFDIGGHKLHLLCTGAENAKVTVVFESGGGGYSQDWSKVLELLPSDVKACAYDRAGSGWSEAGPAPRTFRQEVFELNALLKAANIKSPLILVGHSIGGLLVRLYTEKYSDQVAGIVLVDPTHESSMLGSMRYGGWVRLREKAKGEPIPEPYMGRDTTKRYDQDTDYMAEEFQQIYLSAARNPVPLGDRPLIILVAGKRSAPPGTPDALWKELRHENDSLKRRLTDLSRNSKFILDPLSGHAIHHDNPQLVAHSITEVIRAVVTGSKLMP
jgi:pimeloyl-ACP methyl ester carboxylesterase